MHLVPERQDNCMGPASADALKFGIAMARGRIDKAKTGLRKFV
jgi:hypothetical protein